jgi:hypothetical protein
MGSLLLVTRYVTPMANLAWVNPINHLILLVTPAGFEPATLRLGK